MAFWDGVFHLVFGRRGPRTTTHAPASPPSARPQPAPAAPPAAPPTPAPVEPAPPAPPPVVEAPTPGPVAETAPTPAPEQPALEPEPAPAEPAPMPAPAPTDTAPEPAPTTPAPDVAAAPIAPAEPAPEDFLTPHFRLIEFIQSETAQRQNINNMPPADKLANIRVAAEGMEKVRALLGGKAIAISSGFRCPELNQAIGGSRTSDHMQGFSVDFRCDGFGTPYQIVERLMAVPELMDCVDQIIFEKSRWVHISFAPQYRKQVLTAYERQGEPGTHYIAGLKALEGSHLLQA